MLRRTHPSGLASAPDSFGSEVLFDCMIQLLGILNTFTQPDSVMTQYGSRIELKDQTMIAARRGFCPARRAISTSFNLLVVHLRLVFEGLSCLVGCSGRWRKHILWLHVCCISVEDAKPHCEYARQEPCCRHVPLCCATAHAFFPDDGPVLGRRDGLPAMIIKLEQVSTIWARSSGTVIGGIVVTAPWMI